MKILFLFLLTIFPQCPTEDSQWCVWDAQQQGNGTGNNVVALWSDVYFLVE